MPQSLPCGPRARDFRQHPAMVCAAAHWLRDSVYGRHLLKLKLRQSRPDLAVSLLWAQPQFEGLLEAMVDVLDLRDWPQPDSWQDRLRATRAILGRALAIQQEIDAARAAATLEAAPARSTPAGSEGGRD